MSSDIAPDFDAIVVGSGISGGWAAKELTERGLRVLLIERGKHVEHRRDYVTEGRAPWDLEYRGQVPQREVEENYFVQQQCYAFTDFTKHFFVNDRENPYYTADNNPFSWIRGYHLGGRSLLWHRQSYRLSEMDFEANKSDGHGVDWPIRYQDLVPWYNYVEDFAGISGSVESLPQLPDGVFQPPFAMNCAEVQIKATIEKVFPGRHMIMGRTAHLTKPTQQQMELGRSVCQARNECQRGCSFGAYFSSLSATLPAALRTGRLEIATDSICERVIYDSISKRAEGVAVVNARSKQRRKYRARMVFLCASTLGSTQILLNSRSEEFPTGLANSSGVLGHYLMDHVGGGGARGVLPGLEDQYYRGRRPTGIYIPRFRNLNDREEGFLRGYGYQGSAYRQANYRGDGGPGVGGSFKDALTRPGPWKFGINGFGEMLPHRENRVWLDNKKTDQWGIPILNIDCRLRENELKLVAAMAQDAKVMLEAAGLTDIETWDEPDTPGILIHEMGTARMGRDPATSVLNSLNQAHDVPNLFVTDGAAMTSSACQNPSLTYMALTARACDAAVSLLNEGKM